MRKLRLSGKASRLVSQASEITNPVFNASLDSKHRLQLFFIDHVIFSEGSLSLFIGGKKETSYVNPEFTSLLHDWQPASLEWWRLDQPLSGGGWTNLEWWSLDQP